MAELLPQQAITGGGLVAFVEEQVQRSEDAVEPRGQVLALGDFKRDAGGLDALLGPGELLLDSGVAAEKRAGNLGGAEAAQDLQREDDLGLGRDRRVAAYEHEPQAVIAAIRTFLGTL